MIDLKFRLFRLIYESFLDSNVNLFRIKLGTTILNTLNENKKAFFFFWLRANIYFFFRSRICTCMYRKKLNVAHTQKKIFPASKQYDE